MQSPSFRRSPGWRPGSAERADEVMTLLRAPSTVFLLVAAPRHEAVVEAAWFAGQLAEQGIVNVGGVANRVHPAFGESSADEADRAAADVTGVQRALWRNVAELGRRRQSELLMLDEFLALFDDAPCAEVPLLASDVHDREGLAHVGRHLFDAAE